MLWPPEDWRPMKTPTTSSFWKSTAGGCALVWDPEREGEGDVIVAGANLRPQTIAFILTQACSHPTVPCDLARLERLGIPAMPGAGDHHGTAMHVSVDLSASRGTGVSAAQPAIRYNACRRF